MNNVSKVDNIYLSLCDQLIRYGRPVGNTHELRNIKFTLPDITDNIISVREISASYMFGELLWYFNADNSTEFISKFGSKWSKISDNGITNNSAYGYRAMKEFGFNQIDKVVELLQKDPESRRAVINLNVPNENMIETKDEPCTIALQFYIRDRKLYCTGMMRSNDIWYGLPYDIIFFTELQKRIADRLTCGYGTYTHFAVSLHMYDRDKEKIEKILSNPKSTKIVFDRSEFWKNMAFVKALMDAATKHCDSHYVKSLMLKFAKTFFKYEEGEKDADQSI